MLLCGDWGCELLLLRGCGYDWLGGFFLLRFEHCCHLFHEATCLLDRLSRLNLNLFLLFRFLHHLFRFHLFFLLLLLQLFDFFLECLHLLKLFFLELGVCQCGGIFGDCSQLLGMLPVHQTFYRATVTTYQDFFRFYTCDVSDSNARYGLRFLALEYQFSL